MILYFIGALATAMVTAEGAVAAARCCRAILDWRTDARRMQWCYLYNPGNGEWECVKTTTQWSRLTVTVHRFHWTYEGGATEGYDWDNCTSVERVGIAAWAATRKAKIDWNNPPPGLLGYLDRMANEADRMIEMT